MKNIIKTTAILAVAVLTLTGCAENRESEFNINDSSIIEENITSTTVESTSAESSSTVTTASKPVVKPVEKPTSSTASKPVESNPASSTTSSTASTVTTASKPVEKPVESNPASSTTSSTEIKPTSSTTSKPVEKPIVTSSTSSTTSTTVEKPVEKPVHTHNYTKATCENPATCECGDTKGNALGHNFTKATCEKLATCTTCGITKGTFANHNYNNGSCINCGKNDPDYVAPHNCDKDGHIWEVTYTTTEPKWCREMHIVLDYGFDVTLAENHFPNISDPCRVLWDNMEAMGVDSATGSASVEVEVWGTETYESKECKVCGDTIGKGNSPTINPMGEWRYINGQNPRKFDSRLNFNTLFYDPNNIPQVVIDNINLMWELA